jgi:uncharacterized membrane-anchored protein
MMKRGRLISWEFHNHLEWIAPGKHFVGVGLGVRRDAQRPEARCSSFFEDSMCVTGVASSVAVSSLLEANHERTTTRAPVTPRARAARFKRSNQLKSFDDSLSFNKFLQTSD